ncbi:chloride channel protein [Acidiphilium acidophilum]|uniref:Chloride channel protein n=1 Tax=Acidiphilium acidophilum TaxID=76588 RepID=A0AAW9DXI7_ACIAO|nr:chloride channel protein [Acidiphilium acidophilum]MDX5933007.1 chloride channel protein [Acidiphilium acidophilum]GBR73684.1 CBS domain containing protein [Acidiphilium acidophilum DSM 700]
MNLTSKPPAGVTSLGDFTTDRRLFPLSALAVLAGTFGVAAGWLLLRMIGLINNLVYYGIWSAAMLPPGGAVHHGHIAAWTILIPAAGAVIIGIMARYGSEKIRGHGIPEAIEAIMLGGSKLDFKVAILKPISSAISIGTGGPFGAEGPIIMTGGAAASLMAQCVSLTDAERKTLLVAGACAGMTAVFGTPVAAILLAIELLLFELKPRSLVPVAVACITAAIERRFVLTPAPLFPYTGSVTVDPLHALGWVGLGLAAGFGSALLTIMVYGAEDYFEKLPIHWMWWPVLGGIVVGIGGLIDPLALGVGYPDIAHLLAGALIGGAALRLVLVKSVIWAVALGSGTSGGVLAPLLIMGGALGAVAAPILPHAAPGFWAVVGMAAMMGGTMRAPLTSTLFAVELTGNHLILLPVITASMASMAVTVLLMKRSILTEKIARRGHHLTREYSIDPLAVARAQDIMASPAETLAADMTIDAAIAFFLGVDAQHRAYPITDEAGRPIGLVSRADILAWLGNAVPRETSLATATAGRALVTAWSGEMAITIAARMITDDAPRIPVIDDAGRLCGIISRADLLRVHHRVVAAETKRERFFLRRRARRETTGLPTQPALEDA